MDDLGAAISGFLSQPGAMEQVEAMAKQLGLELPSGVSARESHDAPSETSLSAGLPEGLSPEKLQKVLRAVNEGAKPDRATEFLEALKPLLQPEKQEKLDRAIRAVRLMRTAKTVSKTIEL